MEVVLSIDSPDRCYVDIWEVRFITSEIGEVVPIDRQSESGARSRTISCLRPIRAVVSSLIPRAPRSWTMSFSDATGIRKSPIVSLCFSQKPRGDSVQLG